MKGLLRYKKWLSLAPYSIAYEINMKTFLAFIILSTVSFSQSDWVRWGKSDFSYQKPDNTLKRIYSIKCDNVSEVLTSSLTSVYWFFISDVDGDNCPFRPTCSSFFVSSVKQTNLIQGTLMFFDRFTRDMNFVNRNKHYPQVDDGHFYDPVTLYELNPEKIKYIPPATITKE